MFESTLADNHSESRRPWTVAVSFLAQSALVLLAVLIPLLTTQPLPTPTWMAVLLAPPPLAPPASPEAPQKIRASTVPPQQFDTDALLAPTQIPEDIALVIENAAGPPSLPGNLDAGVGGPIGVPGGVPNGIWVPSKVLPPPPPPPAVPPKAIIPQAVRISSMVQSAKLTHRVVPDYPAIAKQAGISGVVKIEAIIARDGSIKKLKALGGHPLLIKPALEAVQQWRYRPTLLNGEPVEVSTQVEVRFVLR
ncbi:MAG TPA: energy transducer TonB [Bryobacterales bacterium]|nr:energy transducer TonB [Bryobacterales bacterium]